MVPEHESVQYDKLAQTYDRRYKENDYSGIQSCLLEFVGTQLSTKILEVGCGTGHWLTLLAEMGYQVEGLEPSQNMISLAKIKAPNIPLVQGYAEALPWPSKSFDRVFGINTFHHFHDPQLFIFEARRVLRNQGGVMIIGMDPNRRLDNWWIYDYFPQVLDIDKKRYLPTQTIQKMLYKNGFQECRTIEAQHIYIQLPARQALDQGLLAKTSTSQLALLSDQEYEEGIKCLIRDIKAAKSNDRMLTICSDVHLFATMGWTR
jgi:ubiquinone/menaquinone biosynthesis C-methylase UbiE